ncbi:MAG: SNF2-related protein, partial [Chloroflexota bacterium]
MRAGSHELHPGVRVFDRRRARQRLVHDIQVLGRVVKLWLQDPQTGVIDLAIYPATEVESRFEVIAGTSAAFGADSVLVRLVAECRRLEHAYLFNPAFATETSLIDALPHQLLAVYGIPPTRDHPRGQRGLIDYPRLRFLLADDAGAGKTIMAGLYVREMLLRRLVHRVLVVPPAGLVGNWERELRDLFRLRFRIVESADAARENPFLDSRHDLAIVSLDTLRQDRLRRYLSEAPPYDLVIFDEAHKLSARRTPDLTPDKSKRYELAEDIAAHGLDRPGIGRDLLLRRPPRLLAGTPL